jgi:hypothetical protein
MSLNINYDERMMLMLLKMKMNYYVVFNNKQQKSLLFSGSKRVDFQEFIQQLCYLIQAFHIHVSNNDSTAP